MSIEAVSAVIGGHLPSSIYHAQQFGGERAIPGERAALVSALIVAWQVGRVSRAEALRYE